MPLFDFEHLRGRSGGVEDSAVVFTPSGSEFRALPEKVQIQCFSSVERLRYAQDLSESIKSPVKSPPRVRRHTILHRPGPKETPVTSSILLRSLSSKKPLTAEQISKEDALWFSKLPEKVRRGQFSIQEQAIFAGRLDDIKRASSQRSLYLGDDQHTNLSLPSLSSSLSSRSSSDAHNEIEQWIDTTQDMDDAMMESLRWADQSVDLTLDDYHAQLVSENVASSAKRPSYRRGRSLSSFVLRRPSMDLPPAPPLPSTLRIAPGIEKLKHIPISIPTIPKMPFVTKSSLDSPTISAMSGGTESTATHYQDPEARMKLRVYLASPQKFDEAVEFGFPSLRPPSINLDAPRPSTSHTTTSKRPLATTITSTMASLRSKISSPQTESFLQTATTVSDDTDMASLHSQPEAEISDFTAPTTPSATTHSTPRPTTGPVEREMKRPLAWRTVVPQQTPHHNPWDDLAVNPNADLPGREMTLRMTLTRPDLRADEKVLYPTSTLNLMAVQREGTVERDPLKLEDLPILDGSDACVKMGRDGGRKRFGFGGAWLRKIGL